MLCNLIWNIFIEHFTTTNYDNAEKRIFIAKLDFILMGMAYNISFNNIKFKAINGSAVCQFGTRDWSICTHAANFKVFLKLLNELFNRLFIKINIFYINKFHNKSNFFSNCNQQDLRILFKTFVLLCSQRVKFSTRIRDICCYELCKRKLLKWQLLIEITLIFHRDSIEL